MRCSRFYIAIQHSIHILCEVGEHIAESTVFILAYIDKSDIIALTVKASEIGLIVVFEIMYTYDIIAGRRIYSVISAAVAAFCLSFSISKSV